MTTPTVHVPVLMDQVLDGVLGAPSDPGTRSSSPRIVVDGTLGGAGHALRLANALTTNDLLIATDRDPEAVARAADRIAQELGIAPEPFAHGLRFRPEHRAHWILSARSYCELPSLLQELNIPAVDAILLDLGLSSDQLQDHARGFSFRANGPLDLRFDATDPDSESAADLLRRAGEKEIADWIYLYGEERFSRRIARAIVERRRTQPIETAQELADLIHRSVPGRVHGRVDSATRTFQALRIVVNQELDHVKKAIETLPQVLREGGRLAAISFHSLEDRIVKHTMREHPLLKTLTKKPIVAVPSEVDANPRSRSAKLRVAERRIASDTDAHA